jgi:flagellin-like protein
MNVRELFTDDSAVSPVIGVILMVAVTVILAAVIGSFVLNLGGSLQQSAPQATFSFDYEQNEDGSDALEITHDAGDTIEGENLNISSTGATDNNNGELNDPSNTQDVYVGKDIFTGSITSGTQVTINNTTFKGEEHNDFLDDEDGGKAALDLSDATVRVVYNSDNGENSATLSTWEAPDA